MAQSIFSTDITRTVSLWADYPENIILPPLALSGRKDYKDADIISLAYDILKRKQDTPAMVRKNDQGKPVLVYGRRRYLAVKYLNEHLLGPNDEKRKLECKYEAKMTDTQALIAAIAENLRRKDVNPMDHCHNIEKLREECKIGLEEIAGIYFPEATTAKEKADALRWVKERAGLVELAPEAALAVREGEIKITTAKELAKLPADEQRKAMAESKVVAGKKRVTVAAVKARKPAPVPRKPVVATVPVVPKVPSTVFQAAEEMACAFEEFYEDQDNEKAETAAVESVSAYRKLVAKLVPFRNAEDKAA